MHETKKPPYLTQCLRGKGDEIELAFEKSADILFRYFHWVMAVEACTADRQIADHVLEFLDRHVAKRVGSDLLADLLRGVRACDQLFVRRNIGAEIARIQERRRADTDMDFGRAGFAKHRDQVGNRCSTDNGVVDEHDPFSFYNRFENAQLDFDAGFPFLLGRLDEGTADIAVFVERKTERDAGFFGIALCGGKSGVRDTTDEVCVNRVGLCESCTAADSGLVDTDIVYFAVEAGK